MIVWDQRFGILCWLGFVKVSKQGHLAICVPEGISGFSTLALAGTAIGIFGGLAQGFFLLGGGFSGGCLSFFVSSRILVHSWGISLRKRTEKRVRQQTGNLLSDGYKMYCD